MKRVLLILAMLSGLAAAQSFPQLSTQRINFDLQNPPAPVTHGTVAVVGGTGNSTYYVWIVAKFAIGNAQVSPALVAAYAPATLGSTKYLQANWFGVTGATGYDVLLTTTPAEPSGQCSCLSQTVTAATAQITTTATSSYAVTPYAGNSTFVITNPPVGAGESQLTFAADHGTQMTIDNVNGVGAQEFENVLYADQFTGSDVGAKVNAALAKCPDSAGKVCTVVLPASMANDSFSTQIVLNKYGASLACPQGMRLYYTGTDSAVFVGEGANAGVNYVDGSISGCIFDGTNDTNTDVSGIRQVNTQGFALKDGAGAANFTETGDVGELIQNQPLTYNPSGLCPHCADGSQNERNFWFQSALQNNTTQLEFQTVATGTNVNSFEYNRFLGLHLQIQDGQTGILIDGNGTAHTATLSQSIMQISYNINDATTAATGWKAENGGEAFNDAWLMTSEETTGSNAVPYDVDDADSALNFSGLGTAQLAGGGSGVNSGTYVGPTGLTTLVLDPTAGLGGTLSFGTSGPSIVGNLANSGGSLTNSGIEFKGFGADTAGLDGRVLIQDPSTSNDLVLMGNDYYVNGFGDQYYVAGHAGRIVFTPSTGVWDFDCAPTGSKDTAITFTSCASFDSTGDATFPGTITAGSGSNTITTAAGLLDHTKLDATPWVSTGANGLSSGTVTLVAGAGAHTFTTAYTAAPVCTATDTTAADAVQATSSTTAVTLAGTSTDVIAWSCGPAVN